MADRKIILGGKIYEATGTRKVIVGRFIFQEAVAAPASGRIMSSLAAGGGLAASGGIAGQNGGLAG